MNKVCQYTAFQKGCNHLFDNLYLNYFNFFVSLQTEVVDSPICKNTCQRGFLDELMIRQ